MTEYLYFVKFENDINSNNPFDWEKDVFETFNDAKSFAESSMSQHPEIHQTEIIRNDFGECVDSNDLGMIWSWKEAMSDIPEDNELTFSKEETFGDIDFDNEFSDDDIVFETDCAGYKSQLAETYYAVVEVDGKERRFPFDTREKAREYLDYVRDGKDPAFKGKKIGSMYTESCKIAVPSKMTFCESLEVGDEVFCKVNKKSGTVKDIKDDIVTIEFTGGEEPDRIDTYYKTELLPALRTIVEEMEESEDQVECKWCEDLFDKSDCRYETSLGWLCNQCQEALISRGEQLTFRSNNYQENLKETFDPKDTVELYYDRLPVTIYGKKRAVDDWDEKEITTEFTYEVPIEDVATLIWEDFLEDEDVADIPGGFDALEDDAAWNKFLETHFDNLFDKYEKQILDHYEDDAKEACTEYLIYSEGYQVLSGSKRKTSRLNKLEEAEDYRSKLTLCPECGTNSFDLETGICINCGFNNID